MKPPFPAGTIDRFFPNTPHYVFSNFFPSHVEYEGIMFPTVEHAYQAAKTLDISLRMNVMRLPSPSNAKHYGGTLQLREGWDQIKFGIMAELVAKKFNIENGLGTVLLNTGDAELIEGNYWHDQVWGQCYCPRHQWNGANRLGGILMDRRLDLRRQSA